MDKDLKAKKEFRAASHLSAWRKRIWLEYFALSLPDRVETT